MPSPNLFLLFYAQIKINYYYTIIIWKILAFINVT